jgi:hypothetical protein
MSLTKKNPGLLNKRDHYLERKTSSESLIVNRRVKLRRGDVNVHMGSCA